ncbi:MAG: hypothetical protein BRD40_02640 [Bacteroidetes bacterium QS_1_65_9]|nr:MAG: hypothetical protein BRD40_02640 [Bacteroidetes bacterium QS_1_65_9]
MSSSPALAGRHRTGGFSMRCSKATFRLCLSTPILLEYEEVPADKTTSDAMPSAAEVPPDDERLYALIQQEAWLKALDWLHRAWRRLDGDARACRAAEVFDEAFFDDLDARSPDALERRLMLHHGRMRALPAAQLARLTDALTDRKQEAGDDEAVRSLRKLSSDDGDSGRPEDGPRATSRRDVFDAGGVRVTRVNPKRGAPDARASLFKSPPERVFFEALRAVFPTHLVYPNAALSATLDFERLQPKLSQAERDYFFRALVDAVVVDPLGDLRPIYFFELDSDHHDAAEARRRDRRKDAILAKAGQTLYRLRRIDAEAGRAALEKAIRMAVRRA